MKRFKTAQAEYDLFRALHQEVYDFTMPSRETFRVRSPGQQRNRHIYDSTATQAMEQFASRMKAAVLPAWKKWAELTPGSVIPEEEKERVGVELEKRTDIFFNALNHSNFDTEIVPALLDLSVGTGGIMIDEGEFNTGDTFRFANVPLSECYPEKPAAGRIRSGWRKHKIQIGKIEQLWPGVKIDQKLRKDIEQDPTREDEFLQGHLFNPKDARYYHVVLHEKSKDIIFDQSFNSQRFIIFRWTVVPGETYGRGPAMQVLPDVKTLNKIVQFKLEALALAVGGIWTGVNDGVFNPNTVQLRPKTIIPVGSNNTQNPTLSPLQLGGDPTSVELQVRELQDRINRAFFANALGDITDPVRTATENMIRQQEMLKQAGASFGRLRSELIDPLIAAGLDILAQLGQIPEELVIDGKFVTIKHTSPQAQSEDLEDFQSFQTWAATNLELTGPEVFQGVAKVEDFPKVTASMLGITPTLIRTPEEIKALGKAAQEAAEQQMMMQAEAGGTSE
jgi:hypothetical protein